MTYHHFIPHILLPFQNLVQMLPKMQLCDITGGNSHITLSFNSNTVYKMALMQLPVKLLCSGAVYGFI